MIFDVFTSTVSCFYINIKLHLMFDGVLGYSVDRLKYWIIDRYLQLHSLTMVSFQYLFNNISTRCSRREETLLPVQPLGKPDETCA